MSTTILSIILGIGGMVGWGIYDFLGGVFAKQIGSFKSLFWSQLAGLISIFLLAIFFRSSINVPVLVIIFSIIAAMLYEFTAILNPAENGGETFFPDRLLRIAFFPFRRVLFLQVPF